jgi:hypothetical protein
MGFYDTINMIHIIMDCVIRLLIHGLMLPTAPSTMRLWSVDGSQVNIVDQSIKKGQSHNDG